MGRRLVSRPRGPVHAVVLVSVLSLVLALVVTSVRATPADAAGTFTGRVVNSATGAVLAGATVEVRQTDGVTVVGSTVTASDGTFSLAVPGDEYAVYVHGAGVGYENGYLGSAVETHGRAVVSTFLAAVTWAPHDLGDISLETRVFRGRIVDSATGTAVAGAVVEARWTDGTTVESATVTAADGTFHLSVVSEEYAIFVGGTVVGYEDGFVGSGTEPFGRAVVSTFLAAVTWAPHDLGDISLDAVAPGVVERLKLKSKDAGAIVVSFDAPTASPTPDGYVMTCQGPTGAPVTASVAPDATTGGFVKGWNVCEVRATFSGNEGAPAAAKVKVR